MMIRPSLPSKSSAMFLTGVISYLPAGSNQVREERYDVLVEAITAMGMDISSYKWYLDLRKYGTVPHAGNSRGSNSAPPFCFGPVFVVTLSTGRVWARL